MFLTTKTKILAFFVIALALAGAARAQSTTWDSILSNTQWFVPAPNLLAYVATGTTFSDPVPVADQTVWTIPSVQNGSFTGTSQAVFQLGTSTLFTSTTTMNGMVTDSGQVRIVFTQPDTPATIGIGQVRVINDVYFLEMQMITGMDDFYVTHWAYMAPYNGNPSSLPPLVIPPDELHSEEWKWIEGTEWDLYNEDLFGLGGSGTFSITNYDGGYFWGYGSGSVGSNTESFTLLGSATPEGNILFNILSHGILTSMTGVISGSAGGASMTLRTYSTEGSIGDPGAAYLIPEPATTSFLLAGALAALARRRRR